MLSKSFAKSRPRLKVPNVNLVPSVSTTDREGTLPELSLCSHDDNCCFGAFDDDGDDDDGGRITIVS